MTEEKILELAYQHLISGLHTDTGWNDKPEWTADTEQLLKFAQEIYDEGYDDGCFQATGGQ